MSQVSSQHPPHCDAPHGAPSAATGPAQTPSLLPGLEVVTGSAHPVEAAPEEGSLEEVAHSMPQGNGPGSCPALDSTDFDVPTEAVTSKAPPAQIPGPRDQEKSYHVGPASGEPLGLHPTTAKWFWPPLRAGWLQASGERCPGWPQGPPEVAGASITCQPGQQEEQGQHQICRLPDPHPGTGRLLRPLHPVLPVLRVPDTVQHCPGLRHVRLLQLRGLVLVLLLLRLGGVRRLRPALRPGLRHPGRLLRVRRLPGDLHGVLRALLLLLTRILRPRQRGPLTRGQPGGLMPKVPSAPSPWGSPTHPVPVRTPALVGSGVPGGATSVMGAEPAAEKPGLLTGSQGQTWGYGASKGKGWGG